MMVGGGICGALAKNPFCQPPCRHSLLQPRTAALRVGHAMAQFYRWRTRGSALLGRFHRLKDTQPATWKHQDLSPRQPKPKPMSVTTSSAPAFYSRACPSSLRPLLWNSDMCSHEKRPAPSSGKTSHEAEPGDRFLNQSVKKVLDKLHVLLSS